MVNTNNELIKKYFKDNLPIFQIISENNYSIFWAIKISYNDVMIDISGDIGGFSISLEIDGSKYPLWQYDRTVSNATETNSENILYQLKILKQFLSERTN